MIFRFFKLQYLGSSIPENRSMTTETSIVACPFVPIMGSRLELALRIFGHPKESNQSTLAALAPYGDSGESPKNRMRKGGLLSRASRGTT